MVNISVRFRLLDLGSFGMLSGGKWANDHQGSPPAACVSSSNVAWHGGLLSTGPDSEGLTMGSCHGHKPAKRIGMPPMMCYFIVGGLEHFLFSHILRIVIPTD